MSRLSLRSKLAIPPDPAGTLPRRSSRTRSEKRERPSLPAGARLVYKVGCSILRRDRDDLEDTLLQFHANPVIQAECHLVTENANRYLQARHQLVSGTTMLRRATYQQEFGWLSTQVSSSGLTCATRETMRCI
jgi:hypothetical protein